MPDLNLDRLKAVCPQMLTPDGKKLIKPSIHFTSDPQFEEIAETLLRLAEENRKMKRGMDKIVDCFVGCDKCKEKVKRQIAIVEELLAVAARKDDDEKH